MKVTTKHSKSKRKPSSAVYVTGGVVLFLAYLGVAPRIRQSKTLSDRLQETKSALPLVSVEKVKWSQSDPLVVLPSNIQAIDQTTINARTNGYLSARYVDIGSRVTKGEVLAVIESPEVDQQVNQSSADLAKSRAGIGQATADISRMRAAVSTARSEKSRAVSAVAQAQADLDHLKAKALEATGDVKAAKARASEATQRLQVAKADLVRSNVMVAMAKKTADRWHQLELAQAVAGQEADEKEADYEEGLSRVEAAKAEVSSARSEVDNANEGVEAAEQQVQAAKADVKSGAEKVVAAKAGVDAMQSNIDAAQSNLSASESAASAAEATVLSSQAGLQRVSAIQAFEKVVAPFAGVITARNVDVGDVIGPATGAAGGSDQTNAVTKSGLFGLARTDVLRAVINVPEDEIGSIHEGQTADVSVREIPGRKFTGQVFRVSGALDSSTRTLAVEVRIPNADGTLKPGMYGEIKFLGALSVHTIQVPANAVIFDSHGTRVATVGPDGTLHFKAVAVKTDMGDVIDLASGLDGSETIVTNPDDSLQEGEKVTVHQEQS